MIKGDANNIISHRNVVLPSAICQKIDRHSTHMQFSTQGVNNSVMMNRQGPNIFDFVDYTK